MPSLGVQGSPGEGWGLKALPSCAQATRVAAADRKQRVLGGGLLGREQGDPMTRTGRPWGHSAFTCLRLPATELPLPTAVADWAGTVEGKQTPCPSPQAATGPEAQLVQGDEGGSTDPHDGGCQDTAPVGPHTGPHL